MQPCPKQSLAALGVQREHESHWRDDDTCSYCGSLHPDRFFAAIEAGVELIPTDKNYKVYVRSAPGTQSKFYFEHLSVDEQKRFVSVLNSGGLKIGYPGHFYRLPFFVRRKDAAS